MKAYLLYIILFFLPLTTEYIYAQADINNFDLLVGKWEADFGNYKYYEEWKKESDKLTGVGYRIKQGETFDGEKLLLMNIQGFISYIAVVGNQRPVLFALTNNSENNYIFENKEHDFPQRIIYQIINSNLIKVYVEGETKGEIISDEYNLTRITE